MRWWMWVVLVVLLLSGIALVMRIQGQTTFSAVQADLTARGFATTRLDILAAAPPVDADRQQRFRAAMRRIGSWGDHPGPLPGRNLTEQRLSQKDRDQRADMLRLGRSDAEAVAAILAEGPVLNSYYGWMERDPVKLQLLGMSEIWGNDYMPQLLGSRTIMNWWSVTAITADDPSQALLVMDGMNRAADQPATLIDAMISIALHAIHDQTRLYLASRGRLPDAALQQWLHERRDYLAWVAHAFATERCLSFASIASLGSDDLATLGTVGMGTAATSWTDRLQSIPVWLLAGYDGAQGVAEMARSEARMRGIPEPPPSRMPFGLPGFLSAIAIPNLQESAITAVDATYGHRMRQVMGCIASAYRTGKPLPSDTDALARLLPDRILNAVDANHPAIVYERLSMSRLRIGLDPTAARPPLIPADRWLAKTGFNSYDSQVGTPASPKPEVTTRWSLEVDLDAILIPPPEKPAKAKTP